MKPTSDPKTTRYDRAPHARGVAAAMRAQSSPKRREARSSTAPLAIISTAAAEASGSRFGTACA